MSEHYYITTAIDYGNAPPHLGHAYEKVCTDCQARWQRLLGKDTFFLTGTDENAQKVYKAASEQGCDPQSFVDDNAAKFRELCSALNISNDRFIRTTEEDHIRAARHAFKMVWDKGKIYKGTYKGFYCTGCEAFYKGDELVNGHCPTHETKCDEIEEENYFFKMSSYQDRLLEHFESHPDFIVPASRRNEVLNRIKDGLHDISVSRPTLDWGIPVPDDETHAIYVWFDALVNYLSGIGYPDDEYKQRWPADAHVIGKDIIWFHAAIWPCMLMAMDVELPKHICVHGFLHSDDAKMSKTTGNVVDPFELIESFGVDPLRYFLLRETPFGQDGDFTTEALIARRNTDLGNDLGNLLHRTLSMLKKYNEGIVTTPDTPSDTDGELTRLAGDLPASMRRAMDGFEFSVALVEIWRFIRRANKYVEESEPWALAKSGDRKRLDTVLYNLCESMRLLSVLLAPFLPDTVARIRKGLGLGEEIGIFDEECRWGLLEPGTVTSLGEPLFPRLEV